MKKILAAAMAISMTVAASCAFAGCGGNYSETFKGVVSEQSYSSEQEAVQAFFSEEINSTTKPVEYQSAKKESTLSSDEVKEFDLASVDNVERVEKWTVSYSDSQSVADAAAQSARLMSATAAAEPQYATVTVYVVVIRVNPNSATVEAIYEYKYYVPLPEEGEKLSQSYFNSVFDAKKYRNCSLDIESVTKTKTPYGDMKVTVDYTIRIADNVVYYKVKTGGSGGGIGGLANGEMEYYIADTNDGIKCVGYLNGSPFELSPDDMAELGINNFEDVYAAQFSDADYALFVKTDYGFRLGDGCLRNLIMGALAADGDFDASLISDFDGDYKCYVTDGRLSKIVNEMEYTISVYGFSTTAYSELTGKYSDFGSTTVSVPSNVSALLGV